MTFSDVLRAKASMKADAAPRALATKRSAEEGMYIAFALLGQSLGGRESIG